MNLEYLGYYLHGYKGPREIWYLEDNSTPKMDLTLSGLGVQQLIAVQSHAH